jgi:hypothetical protein
MKSLIYLIIILWASVASAESLGCDIPDAAQDVVSYGVTVNSDPEVIVPYALNAAADAVLLWDIAEIDTATFSVVAINSQGRRSAAADPFVLEPKPSALSGYRIIVE